MSDFDLDAYLDAAAAWFSYDLSDESRAAVRANLALLRANSRSFMDIELDPHLDPAAVLRL
jgi:hypothetical protein